MGIDNPNLPTPEQNPELPKDFPGEVIAAGNGGNIVVTSIATILHSPLTNL
jgi:hypothetical protein